MDYDEEIQSKLVELMRSTPKVINITLDSSVLRLTPAFWSTSLHKPLRGLEIQGWKSISIGIDIPLSVSLDKLVLCYHPDTIALQVSLLGL